MRELVNYLQANEVVLTALLGDGEIKFGQAKRRADLVAGM